MPSATTSAQAGPSSSSKPDPTTSTLLLSTLTAYSDLTKQLFSLIENPTSSQKSKTISDPISDKTWTVNDISSILTALSEVDQLFSSHIQIAHQHAINQARIEALKAQAKKRDRDTRQAILELSKIQFELSEITHMSQEELASIERAEKRPIGHATLLSYAQRLAKYTSAPPGYKLPQVAAARLEMTKKEEGEGAEGAEGQAISLGADYNQYAKRAAAYYDPAIPSMPQEMPFPSDAMMRQGILNSSEMLDGAPMAEQPKGTGADEMVEDGEETMLNTDFATSYSHLREQQREEVDDEDAFDLDLN